MSSKEIPRSLWILVGLSLVLTVIMAGGWLPFLRGGDGQRWLYVRPGLDRWMPLALGTVIYTFGAAQILYRIRRIVWPIFVWSILGTITITWLAAYVRDGNAFYTLFARTVSPPAAGFHCAAAQIQGEEWRHWSAVMDQSACLVATSPPGGTLWYGWLNATLGRMPQPTHSLQNGLRQYSCAAVDWRNYSPAEQASTWFGMSLPFWSALTVIPLYAITKRIKGVDARAVVTWWPLVPGVAGFGGSWDTLYPLFSVTIGWMLLVGLENTRYGHEVLWIIGAGILFGLALFLSFTLLPVLVLFGFFTLGRYLMLERHRENPLDWLHPFSVAVWFWLGIVPIWVIYRLAGGETIFDILGAARHNQAALGGRYWTWVALDMWDWWLWSGLIMAGLWIVGTARGLHLWLQTKSWRYDGIQPPMTGVALLLTMLTLALSGFTRGESGRLWLFMSPFLLVSAVYGLRHLTGDGRAHGLAWWSVLVTHAALTVVLAANLVTMPTSCGSP